MPQSANFCDERVVAVSRALTVNVNRGCAVPIPTIATTAKNTDHMDLERISSELANDAST
jgi:hypothetical protein